MASGAWQIRNYPATATQASASQAAPASGASTGQTLRLRAIQATLACGATAATPLQVVVRDGASGSGTIIWSATLAAPPNGSGLLLVSDLDLRASPGNALTVEFTGAGATASQEAVSAQGDMVPAGYPMGAP